MERRAVEVKRLLARAELVVLHDSQGNHLGYPDDYVYGRSRWDGRRTKTHISPLADEKGGDSVYTTLIQGDLDRDTTGRAFFLAQTFLREKWAEFEDFSKLADSRGSAEGSHAKFLAVQYW